MKTTYTEHGDTKTEDLDEYGDMYTKFGDDNTMKIVSSYAMIQAYYKMMGHIAKKISKLEDEIDNLKSKE